MRDQLQRSTVSIMASIAEGFGRRGRQEFIQFLKIARGSCSEVQSHLYVALDAGLISQQDFELLKAY
ncbi:MAG: four helix bundle protein [Xanthomonadaceae bacterium]|nr:four helix bundle protein [Xanthomonadaceae bacterium]